MRLDVHDLETVWGEPPGYAGDAEVICVLVIDLVIGGLRQDVAEIGILEYQDPARLEQMAHALRERMQIVDVAEAVSGRGPTRRAKNLPRVPGPPFVEEPARAWS